MGKIEKILSSLIILISSASVWGQASGFEHQPRRSYFSYRDEQLDRDETILLLNEAATDEEEVQILEERLEQIRERLNGVSPDCRF